jgi:hypothetical protein
MRSDEHETGPEDRRSARRSIMRVMTSRAGCRITSEVRNRWPAPTLHPGNGATRKRWRDGLGRDRMLVISARGRGANAPLVKRLGEVFHPKSEKLLTSSEATRFLSSRDRAFPMRGDLLWWCTIGKERWVCPGIYNCGVASAMAGPLGIGGRSKSARTVQQLCPFGHSPTPAPAR